MKYKTISFDKIDNILVLQLNNPQKLNSLSQLFFDEFDEFIELTLKDNAFNVLIIKGLDDIFSAGGDLKEIGSADYERSLLMCMRVQKSFGALQNLPIPVIAILQGLVFGGGLELALHCDIRFSTNDAILKLPESELGLIPGAGGISILSRYFSPGDAAYYLFTGNQISIAEAKSKGLIQKVFSKEEIYQETLKFAKDIALKSSESLAAIKKVLISGMYNNLEDSLMMESREFSSVLQRSGREKIKLFFDSRNKK
ncbi:MAG: enoyl-CoA hydratase/isomerase family protein [Bacteroidales bacterium]|nr:enoyl-CoA hydratase/isomerase family protein [Bacteroidales bacterium]MDD3860507.1 enoyl-CoA hydratase/isomerase family protein [Bacteroidales bacterium]